MRKIFAVILMLIMLTTLLCGCNQTLIDTVKRYDYAIVAFPDGTTQKIALKEWTDYEDGEQLQIKATDGTVYLVNSVNCVLVRESN